MASRCEDGTVTGDFVDELPNFHIDTFSDLEEHSGRFAEVSESDVEKFIEGGENENTKKDLLRLKISQKVSGRKAPRNQTNREDSSTESDSYLSQFVLATRTKAGKDYEPSSLRRILAGVERHLSHSDPETVISKKK